jgi:hypothetical protein
VWSGGWGVGCLGAVCGVCCEVVVCGVCCEVEVCCVCCEVEVCCVCCVLSGRGLCDELITRQRIPTNYGASFCVIKKPSERGGHSLRQEAIARP